MALTAWDALAVISRLEQRGIEVWVDGGWGVDALVGEQTRDHSDLDLALDRTLLSRAQAALEEIGYRVDPSAAPGLPARLLMADEEGHLVDLHPLVFDEEGSGWQQLSDSEEKWGRYPVGDLQAKGRIGGRDVRCLSAGLQYRFHLGYEHTERDEHDLRLLAERFGVGPPT